MVGQFIQSARGVAGRVKRKLGALVRHYTPVFWPRVPVQLARASLRPVRRIALVVSRNASLPPTAHIRVLRPFAALASRMALDVQPVTPAWLLDGGIGNVDAVLVQRDSLPPGVTDTLIGELGKHQVPMLYEIDDWLWNLPDDHTDHAITDAHVVSMKKLVAAATISTVSTPRLAQVLQQEGGRVVMIPNALDEALWDGPLPAGFVTDVGRENGLSTQRTTLLYMGTKSHAEDLKLIIPAVERLRERYPDLDIIQVGGGTMLPGAREITRPRGEYPVFVAWFRAVCSYATFAVAPLRDDAFNSAKSDIKILDYGFGRIPAVYSNVGPYRDSVRDGVTGLLCDNRTDAWFDAMSRMLDDAGLREKIVADALAYARKRSLASEGAASWQAAVSGLWGKAPAGR